MKKIFTGFVILIALATTARAQSVYLPYSYDLYQKFDSELYSTKTREHTSMVVFADDTGLNKRYNQILYNGSDTTNHHSWFVRKLLYEHLFEVKQPDYTFYGDFLPDFVGGKDFSGHQSTYIYTRGYQFGGTVGKNFYFFTSGFEDQAKYPEYLNTYIKQTGIVPGEAYDRSFGKSVSDWSYVTAILSYTPIKYLNIELARDKNFIGDGYRSLLLSDYSSPYNFLKLTATLGNVRYTAMWAEFDDPRAPKFDDLGNDRRKWGAFHYLDWNVSNRVTLGFFDAVIWPSADDQGHSRGFDVEYINPVIFTRPVEASAGSPDNALIGFTGKYKAWDQLTIYGQFMLDEFQAKQFFSDGGSSRNKYGYQIGIRGGGLFGVQNLNYLVETNAVKPYTYSERSLIENYTANGEPLAHPWGANFREVVGKLNYSYKRFDFSGELDYGHYGLDTAGFNYGKDPWQDYTAPAKTEGNYIGQGLTTNMVYVEGKVAYIVNPKYNLRLELGGLIRREKNSLYDDKTTMITFGLRSSFRAIYNDIASYKVH